MVFEKVKELLLQGWSLDEDEVSPETKLVNDLYMDELDIADLIMDIEDTFAFEVDDEFNFFGATVGSLVKYIEENI